MALDRHSQAVTLEAPRESYRPAAPALEIQPESLPRPIRLSPWHVEPAREPHRHYYSTKRAIDLVGGLVLFVLSLPIIAAAALAVAVTTGAWPFYVQVRVGHLGKEFRMLKIRTMRRGADREIPLDLNETAGPTFKALCDPRITPVGRILRRTSIDEFPQFFNVVCGHLSLVGPRPGLPSEVRQYTPSEARRLSVKPGLTAIWQVSGRSDIPFRRWMAMDRLYIQKRSLLLDLALIARTPWTVITMRGAR